MEEVSSTTAANVEVVNQADCYFYYYSSCNKGSACPYRHEPSALRNETMCVYWLKGNCNKPQCFYRHMEIEKPRDKIPCFYESKPSGCKKLHCPFLHNNVLDQPREEDVAKNPDIILPVKDSEAEYLPEENDSKKLQANISAQIRLQRQMFESEDTVDVPSPPIVIRKPIIVPLHDGESDSESVYCPSPNKLVMKPINAFDPETDWELGRLREIQMEESNILGYPCGTGDSASNTRHAVISSSSNDSYENEEYISEEEIIEEHIVEDVKDAVHRRLQQPFSQSQIRPSNFKINFANDESFHTRISSHTEPVRLRTKVRKGFSSARHIIDNESHTSEDEEIISSHRPMNVNRKPDNRLTPVKKPLSVKERLGFKTNLDKVLDLKQTDSLKSHVGLGSKLEKLETSKPVRSDRKSRIGLSKASIQNGPLKHLGLDINSKIIKGIKDVRLGTKDSNLEFKGHRLKAIDSKLKETRLKVYDSKLYATQPKLSLSASKILAKSTRVMEQNSEVGIKNTRLNTGEILLASNVQIGVKNRLCLKKRNPNSSSLSSANLIIKSLSDIKVERGITNTSNRRGRISSNLIDLSLSSSAGEQAKAVYGKTLCDVGVIKIKTLAEIKAERGVTECLPQNKVSKRPISPIHFTINSSKKHKLIDSDSLQSSKEKSVTQSNGNLLAGACEPVLKSVVLNNAFNVGSRKLSLKKTSKMFEILNHDRSSNSSGEVTIKSFGDDRLTAQKLLSSSTFNVVDKPLSTSTTTTSNSKTIVKLNLSTNDLQKIQRRFSVSNSNKNITAKISRLDSFMDEDELLGDDLHDSYGDDEEINEEELLM